MILIGRKAVERSKKDYEGNKTNKKNISHRGGQYGLRLYAGR